MDVVLHLIVFFLPLKCRCWVPSGCAFHCKALWFYPRSAKRNSWKVRSWLWVVFFLFCSERKVVFGYLEIKCTSKHTCKRLEGHYRCEMFSLQTKFADDPLTWDYMARRELELGSLQSTEHSSTKQMKVSEVTQREERCCAVFEEAVGAVPTGQFCLHFSIIFSWYFSILWKWQSRCWQLPLS